jgi:hypothetical protein
MPEDKKTPEEAPERKAPTVKDLPEVPSEKEDMIKGGAKRRFGESSE